MPNKTQDYYPQEKGVIRRDRAGEFRDVMAKELMMESLGLIPVAGALKKGGSILNQLGKRGGKFLENIPRPWEGKIRRKSYDPLRRGRVGSDYDMPIWADKKYKSIIEDLKLILNRGKGRRNIEQPRSGRRFPSQQKMHRAGTKFGFLSPGRRKGGETAVEEAYGEKLLHPVTGERAKIRKDMQTEFYDVIDAWGDKHGKMSRPILSDERDRKVNKLINNYFDYLESFDKP